MSGPKFRPDTPKVSPGIVGETNRAPTSMAKPLAYWLSIDSRIYFTPAPRCQESLKVRP
jgi:hypothetical protein